MTQQTCICVRVEMYYVDYVKIQTKDDEILKIITENEETYDKLFSVLSKMEHFTTSCEPAHDEKACFMVDEEEAKIVVVLK